MIKSMTGFSKTEGKTQKFTVVVEIKSLNGKNLDINTRLPRNLSIKEIEVRELVKGFLSRGTVVINVNINYEPQFQEFNLNQNAIISCYNNLNEIKKQLNIRESVKMEHVYQFAGFFLQKEEDDNSAEEWQATVKIIKEGLKNLDKMRVREGQFIQKDLTARLKKITDYLEEIEALATKRIPDEREKYRQKVAQLFESDEIDEHRIQIEIVLLADKLDVSEECVRLRSHLNYFNDLMKDKEQAGRKLNFLIQEMHREINTIGSKANSAEISRFVVDFKEELERIREQIQNIE